jgi:hypothetical protein
MVNILAVIVSAIAYMVLGFLWYSKWMFEKPWMDHIGMSRSELRDTQRSMTPSFAMMFLASLIIAYLIGYFVDFTATIGITTGAILGFLLWLLLACVNLSSVIFERKHVIVYLIGIGYNLVGFLVMGAIMTAWR